jgi:hypothetical protein
MTNYRILLLCFVTISWFFLSGLNRAIDVDTPSTEEIQKTEAELKSIETENNARKLQETKQVQTESLVKSVKAKPEKRTIKAKDAGVADDINPVKRNEPKKPLDLSIPFNNSDNADPKIEQKSAAQNGVKNIFAPETKKKRRPLELDGDFLMSPEPEAEKLKSVDGAGIVIKLKQ